ncbi:hypothetical protein EON83_21990 [bacterium]|nr:MAG: hypothetical protein EON83_21990 [bacterium]
MKKINSAILLLSAFLVALSGPHTPSAKGQPIFMEPSQNKDPAYAQLDLSNRMNQWNIRQLGFQIVGNARFQKRGKPMSQAEINRIIQNAKKLNRYNSPASITKYKDSGKSIIPARLLQGVPLDDINKRLAIGLMEKSLTSYLTTSMHDGFESNDLAWATVYFLDLSYLVSRDSGRPAKSSTQYTSISPELSYKIYRDIHSSLVNNPKVRKMTDAQKQMACENLVIMAGTNAMLCAELIDPMSQLNLGDGLYGPKTSPQDKEKRIVDVKQQAKRNLEQVFGVPAAKIQITGNGVVFK